MRHRIKNSIFLIAFFNFSLLSPLYIYERVNSGERRDFYVDDYLDCFHILLSRVDSLLQVERQIDLRVLSNQSTVMPVSCKTSYVRCDTGKGGGRMMFFLIVLAVIVGLWYLIVKSSEGPKDL